MKNSFAMPAWILAVGLLVMSSGPASAHVVPPEELHPVAESYRRAGFILNLNPVLWPQVWSDLKRIEEALRGMDSPGAKKFSEELAVAKRVAQPVATGDGEPDMVAARKNGSRLVFSLATRGVASLLISHLDGIKPDSGRTEVKSRLNEARRIFQAFAETLQHLDPEAWKKMRIHWLEANSHLGAAGVMGIGARPMNLEKIRENTLFIRRYFYSNFSGFRAGKEHRLLPRPKASKTYIETAKVPWRLPPGSDINKQLPRPRQILGMAERGANEAETFLIAFGDMAFDSPEIFGEPARSLGMSCNTCHNKGVTNPKFFIPGLSRKKGGMDVSNSFFAGHANNGLHDPLDTPDLRGIRFTAPYGRNGRFASLREFVRNVIVNEFNGPEPDPMIMDGMIAYMNEFEFLPNPKLKKSGRLNPGKVGKAALRGEKIFHRKFPQMMGGMSCASCHIPNANFVDHKRHNIGSTGGGSQPFHVGGLDTPTLLSSKFTAPYFHDGSLPTLRAVNEWFNTQFNLGLSREDIDDLTVYVEAVGDGVQGIESTVYTLESELEEFKFFLSTYERLKQKKKQELITVLLKTVVREVQAHKWDVQDRENLPILNEMEEKLNEALRAHLAGDEKMTDSKIAAYHAIYQKNQDKLK
ncbi:MAG: hypothetical protein OXL41_09710 [Nitrospinae bacterium]|nr:hypothetical protein [Nitrospinota bacterium]